MAEYENRLAITNQELERLKSVIKSKDIELEKSRMLMIENESNKSKIKEFELTMNKYEF